MPQTAPTSSIPLADHAIDRAAHRRKDTNWLNDAFNSNNAQVCLMQDGAPLVSATAAAGEPGTILWLGAQAGMLSEKAKRIFLGENDKGDPVFALDLPTSFSLNASPIAGLGVFEEFRMTASAMSPYDAGIAATSRGIFEWHNAHGYCANCGCPTKIAEAGWKRTCPDCGKEHFPRIDPVAIMLAVKDDQVLLGRQAEWPEGMWSCLAGFIEPGESIEQAAARELFEEAGIKSNGQAEYLFCQPWPFPSSLMIGLILQADSEELNIDKDELETARWFTRQEMTEIMAGTHPDVQRPRPIAVAHHVMQAWLDRG